MKFTRQPVVSSSDKLTSLELYMLIDSYMFIKGGIYFPESPPEITELEVLFLEQAHKVHADLELVDVNSPQFSKGMEQIDAMDRGGVRNF